MILKIAVHNSANKHNVIHKRKNLTSKTSIWPVEIWGGACALSVEDDYSHERAAPSHCNQAKWQTGYTILGKGGDGSSII